MQYYALFSPPMRPRSYPRVYWQPSVVHYGWLVRRQASLVSRSRHYPAVCLLLGRTPRGIWESFHDTFAVPTLEVRLQSCWNVD